MDMLQKARTVLEGCAASCTGPHELKLHDGSRRVLCAFASIDSLACEFHHLTVESTELADASMQRLREISEQLSGQLTYLLEPIAPIETDAEGCVVQMRSNPPQRSDDGASYYELLVRRGGELSLCRWKKMASGERIAISSTVTHEVMLRLISDLASAAG